MVKTVLQGRSSGTQHKTCHSIDKSGLPAVLEYCTTLGWLLRGQGLWRSTICPFHQDTHPSLSISMASGAFKCHACGAKGGDLIALHQQRLGISFRAACQDLGICLKEIA